VDKEGQLMAAIAGSREEFMRTQLKGMPQKEAADAMAAVGVRVVVVCFSHPARISFVGIAGCRSRPGVS
jgi:hypothetical protein